MKQSVLVVRVQTHKDRQCVHQAGTQWGEVTRLQIPNPHSQTESFKTQKL